MHGPLKSIAYSEQASMKKVPNNKKELCPRLNATLVDSGLHFTFLRDFTTMQHVVFSIICCSDIAISFQECAFYVKHCIVLIIISTCSSFSAPCNKEFPFVTTRNTRALVSEQQRKLGERGDDLWLQITRHTDGSPTTRGRGTM